jgi:chromosomal replication initiation ATPase DnaA
MNTTDQMQSVVCHTFNVTFRQLRERNRSQKKGVMQARFAYYLLSFEQTKNSYSAIGRPIFRSSASVFSGIDSALRLYAKDQDFKDRVDFARYLLTKQLNIS